MLFLPQSYVLRPPNFCQIAPFDVPTAGGTQWALYSRFHIVLQRGGKDAMTWCIEYTRQIPFPQKSFVSFSFLFYHRSIEISDEIDFTSFNVTEKRLI